MSGAEHDLPHATTDLPGLRPGRDSAFRAGSSILPAPANTRAMPPVIPRPPHAAYASQPPSESAELIGIVAPSGAEIHPHGPGAPSTLEEGERAGGRVRIVRWNGASDALYRAPEHIPVVWYVIEPSSGLAGANEDDLRGMTFPATSLALLPPAEPFRFRPNGPGAGAFIECDTGLDDAVGRVAANPGAAPPYRFVHDAVALDVARLIVTLSAADPDGRNEALLADLARVCVERVADRLSDALGRDPRSGGGLDPARLARVTRFVEAELAGPLRLAELAAVACLSSSQFCRAFKASTGTSPLRYVRARRLARARALLLDAPEVPIAEVAGRCGFVAQSHLTRLMRAELGITPAALRRGRFGGDAGAG